MDSFLGVTLIGTWATMALVVVELMWAVQYFRYIAKQDRIFFRLVVAAAVIIDFTGLLGSLADVYLYCVSHWGDLDFLQRQVWPVPYCFITGIVVNFIVQLFLIWRYRRLSKNWVVALVLILLVLLALGSGFSTAILSVVWHTVDQRLKLLVPLKLWLSSDLCTSMLISFALIYEFYGRRTGTKASETIVRRFTVVTLQSGIVPALCALSALIAFETAPATNISAIFLWFHPRAYLLSMLYTLIVREKIREDMKGGAGNPTTGGSMLLRDLTTKTTSSNQ